MSDEQQIKEDLAGMVGTVLAGTYRLDALIGEGGMGAVYRGRHVLLRRDVAIKVLHPDFSRDPELVKRFDREAQSAARLNHPNCIQVTEFGSTDEGMKYLVMQLLEGTELQNVLDGPTPPERVLRIVDAAVTAGSDRIAIADTIGTTTPGRVTSLLAQVRPEIGALPLGCHFHNTRGAGLASAYAAVLAGVSRLDASVGGLGGCPFAPGASGNIATEDLVYLLRDSGVAVDLDLDRAIAAAGVAQRLIGKQLPSALLRAGDRLHAPAHPS